MIRHLGPVSNTERQRQFRQRHPGYYGRLHRQRRAEVETFAKAKAAERHVSDWVAVMLRVPLMLPAPVETVEIPGMTTIGTTTPVAVAALAA